MNKNIKLFGLALLVVGLMISVGCKKEYIPSLTCKVAGTEYTSVIPRTTTKGGISDWNKEGFVIVTTDAITNGKFLTLLVAGSEAKEYALEPAILEAKAGCSVVYNPGGEGDTTSKYMGKSGKLTITSIDDEEKRVSGTFSFEMVNTSDITNTLSITEGVFTDLKFTNIAISTTLIQAFAAVAASQ